MLSHVTGVIRPYRAKICELNPLLLLHTGHLNAVLQLITAEFYEAALAFKLNWLRENSSLEEMNALRVMAFQYFCLHSHKNHLTIFVPNNQNIV